MLYVQGMADLAQFAVGNIVQAEISLPLNDVRYRVPNLLIERGSFDFVSPIVCKEQREQPLWPRETARMSR